MYYSKFASPKMYLHFGDMIEQDEFNAAAFLTTKGFDPIPDKYNNIRQILHKINTVYFFSLARYIMNYLSGT